MAKALLLLLTAACLGCAVIPSALAQSSGDLKFPQYLNSRRSLSPPFLNTDKVPIVRGSQAYQVPGSDFLTTLGPQEIRNKSIDCTMNTCLNFPLSTAQDACTIMGNAGTSSAVPVAVTLGPGLACVGGQIAVTGGGALPTSCGDPGGAIEGGAWNNSGQVEVCSTIAVTWGGVPLTWGGVPITSL